MEVGNRNLFKMNDRIIKPTLLIDENRCKNNIRKMSEKAKANNCIFRPHFKTHQSIEIGNWFKEEGVYAITVSSLEMAEYFSKDWKDITVAFPCNILEINSINNLASKIKLNLIVESIEVVDFLENNVTSPIQLWIKVDVGYNRTGIDYREIDSIQKLANQIQKGKKISLLGLLAHSGHTYSCSNISEIERIHKESVQHLIEIKNKLILPTFIKLSIGDTPSCSTQNDFSMVDEIRPGNFVFYDLTQFSIGSNKIEDIALTVACPIVSIHKSRNEIVIYGGGIHFSKDRITHPDYGIIFGLVVEKKENTWGKPIDGFYVSSLSQEHGILKCPENLLKTYNIGDIIYILPVHSCMTAKSFKEYLFIDSQHKISRF